ncbi:S-adenosyl-l-methionine hydroxide adenosyltransferase family protein [Flavobacterium sp. ASW18X]|uniref:SAM hydrolase/SAM-dependent halogenase family protein n=1 Tax=Flavobacterium sp. ASW18X TaxID=2572595 RepID=UPI0010ADF0F9|nr:SAM-dependent chlorinase/fluorinase [Flavobacterium sp. ASW18X]TKD66278.1 hypothetical protein FBT53_05225 [Flavobacterium sp. ASW18X]
MALITLTTDFGTKDHFAAVVKGTILKEVPQTTVVDISHQVAPFNIQECAYLVKNSYHAFPKGSIHIVGIDSEWSPENEHIIVLVDGHYFVSANNGVISLITSEKQPEKLMVINLPNTDFTSFPVLDIFVPVACHLARGGQPEVLSSPFTELKELRDFKPRIENNGKTIIGNVIYIDNYGNVVTNIQKSTFEAYRNGREFEINARREKIYTIEKSYNGIVNFELDKNKRKGPGDLLALFNAADYLELAIFKSDLNTVGGASTLIGLHYRDIITINFL